MTSAIQVTIDLNAIASNAALIKRRVGYRQVYAVVKADGYGCGIRAVSRAVADRVDGFYVFDLAESAGAELGALGKPVIALDQPWHGYTPADYLRAKTRPIVSTVVRAKEMLAAKVDPVLSIDTGMRRFGAEGADVDEALRLDSIREVMTHAVRMQQVERLMELAGNGHRKLHAAGSALIDEPKAWLDGVRPGLALYRGTMRVTARVVEARDVRGRGGRAGYTQFPAERVGVILAGYTNGLKPGPCMIRGEVRKVYEVGMQSAYVELKPAEGIGEEVVLLGDGLTEAELAAEWGTGEQEVLVRLGRNRKA